MRDYGDGHFLNLLRGDELLASEERQGLGSFHQGDRGTRAGAELNTIGGARRAHQRDHVRFQFIADADFLGGASERVDVFESDARLQIIERMNMLLRCKDSDFFMRLNVPEREFQGEAVHLRLRERIGAAKLDGVLRGNDEEEFGEARAVHLRR